MQKSCPNWLNKTQLHQASLLISELNFYYGGICDDDEFDQKIGSILDWDFLTVYQDCSVLYARCCEARYYTNLPDDCTLNDVYDLVDKAKKLIKENKYIPDPPGGIQLELFPI
ncbi:MAG: hypothetical protein U1V55_07605 [Planktothrix rubescens PR222]